MKGRQAAHKVKILQNILEMMEYTKLFKFNKTQEFKEKRMIIYEYEEHQNKEDFATKNDKMSVRRVIN